MTSYWCKVNMDTAVLAETVLISYMALAEDEEIRRVEKGSSLGEKTARRKNGVTYVC